MNCQFKKLYQANIVWSDVFADILVYLKAFRQEYGCFNSKIIQIAAFVNFEENFVFLPKDNTSDSHLSNFWFIWRTQQMDQRLCNCNKLTKKEDPLVT